MMLNALNPLQIEMFVSNHYYRNSERDRNQQARAGVIAMMRLGLTKRCVLCAVERELPYSNLYWTIR